MISSTIASNQFTYVGVDKGVFNHFYDLYTVEAMT